MEDFLRKDLSDSGQSVPGVFMGRCDPLIHFWGMVMVNSHP